MLGVANQCKNLATLMEMKPKRKFNGENENTTVQLDDSFDDTNRRFVRRIQEQGVREALKRMKVGKAMRSRCGDVSGI